MQDTKRGDAALYSLHSHSMHGQSWHEQSMQCCRLQVLQGREAWQLEVAQAFISQAVQHGRVSQLPRTEETLQVA